VKYATRLFAFSGISNRRPNTSFYPQRFKKWCAGTTPYPIVNACMKQLNSTGYMSNRGRQLVASCLVHELALDWRYGAAYMEQQLIDYDMASNWGNWQYLAGVGADPRGHRRFNLAKQAQTYDPEGLFIERWQGNNADSTLDYTDAADWPVASQ
jgi:deoxyribodipyrimidine photo-lyase